MSWRRTRGGVDDGRNLARRAVVVEHGPIGFDDRDLRRVAEYLIGEIMNRLIYIVGLVVVVMAVLWFFGFR